MPLAPPAWLLSDGNDAAIGEREYGRHRVLKRSRAVRSDRAGHPRPQRVWRRVDRSDGAAAPGAVVTLAEGEQEQQAGEEDDARGRQPARRERTGGELTLLPRRRCGDDRPFAELEACLDPAVLADPTRVHLQPLNSWLGRQFGHALRVDNWPRKFAIDVLELTLETKHHGLDDFDWAVRKDSDSGVERSAAYVLAAASGTIDRVTTAMREAISARMIRVMWTSGAS